MFHMFKQTQFTVGPFGMYDGLKWSGQFLHSHSLGSFSIEGRATKQVSKSILRMHINTELQFLGSQ